MISRCRIAALAAALLPVLLLSTIPRSADAIPVFSRKYATSCATCHVAFPKLNAFGRAFRNNGYRMPGGDEGLLEDENIKLGADPWKRLWPEAIWPSDIPYQPPVSLLVESEIVFTPNEDVKTDFRTPNDVSVLTAGTLGDSMSWYGRVNLVAPGEGVHLHQLFGQFNRLFDTPLINIRAGQIEPRAVPFSGVHRLAKTDYLLNSATLPLETWVNYLRELPDDDHEEEDDHGDEFYGRLDPGEGIEDDDHDEGSVLPDLVGIGGHGHSGAYTLGTTQLGIELWGAQSGLGGRGGLEYAVGLVNGNGTGQDPTEFGSVDNNSAKDVYWRASYKFGGMSVVGDPETTPSGMNNWVDNSLRLGVFGYHGKAPFTFLPSEPDEHVDELVARATTGRFSVTESTLDGVGGVVAEENYRRIGADLDVWWGDLNVFGAFVKGRTSLSPGLLENATTDFTSLLTQADYMVYPWLVTSVRYERVDYDGAFGDVARWVPHVTALFRANVRFLAELAIYEDRELFPTQFKFSFDFAF